MNGGWVLDLPALSIALGTVALYLRGHQRRRRFAGTARAAAPFLLGVAIVVFSHVSPLAGASGERFAPHMVQHLLLVVVAAPLLAAGTPASTLRLVMPAGFRRPLVHSARRVRHGRHRVSPRHPLVVATAVHVVAIWLWHAPQLYSAALRSPGLHLLEHLAFIASATWFWSELRATRVRSPLHQWLATMCLGAMIVQGGVLGAVLAFAGRPLYDVYASLGAEAMADQQLAGVLMWIPPAFVYAPVAVRRFTAWLQAVDQASRRPTGRAGP